MDIEDFHALRTGTVVQPDGAPATLKVLELGNINVPSGRLRACDPFVNLVDSVATPVPPGSYPVKVTVADISPEQDGSHSREAFLSVILADGEAASVGPAPSADGEPTPPGWFGVGVDAGTVGFVDADAVASGMPSDPQSWYDGVYDNGQPDSWFNLMDAANDTPPHTANIPLPLATRGENVVLSHSGWGDGFYPLAVTYDANGNPLAIHIDLLVVGPDGEEETLDADSPPTSPGTPAPDSVADAKPGLFRQLFKQ